MTDIFKEGEDLKALVSDDDYFIRVGHYGITRITVVYEGGQGGGVPWFAVYKGAKLHQKYNGALIEGVEY